MIVFQRSKNIHEIIGDQKMKQEFLLRKVIQKILLNLLLLVLEEHYYAV